MEIYVAVILSFLIFSFVILHCKFLSFREKLTQKFLSALNSVLSEDEKYSKDLKNNIAKTASYLTVLVLLIFLISIILSAVVPNFMGDDENKFFGPVGDLFNGIVTPILTFLTFCGLLVTILIQNIQMKSTLEELELTREEMKKSNVALDLQVKNSVAQKFDNNFFSLLDNHKKVVDEFQKKIRYKNISDAVISTNDISIDENALVFFSKNTYFWRYWSSYSSNFLSFFLINYNIINYIDKHVANHESSSGILSFDEAKTYANILRAMLPNSFLFLIFLNLALGDFGKYKKLIEKYGYLEHMQLEKIDISVILNLTKRIDISAFGRKDRLIEYLENEWVSNDLMKYLVEIILNHVCSVLNLKSDNNMDEISNLLNSIRHYFTFEDLFDKNGEGVDRFLKQDANYFLKLKNLTPEDLIKKLN